MCLKNSLILMITVALIIPHSCQENSSDAKCDYYEDGVYFNGTVIDKSPASKWEECCEGCTKNHDCFSYSYHNLDKVCVYRGRSEVKIENENCKL